MPSTQVVEIKELILHSLAAVKPTCLTNQDIAGILSKPIIQVNRALNNIMQAKVPMVELAGESDGGGYRFIGNEANLLSENGSDSIETVSIKTDMVEEPASELELDVPSANPKVVSAIARMFGKKKIMEENAAVKTVGAPKDEFNAAAIALEKLGGLNIVDMDDFEERAFRKTGKTASFINYHVQFEKKAEPKPEVIDEPAAAEVEAPKVDRSSVEVAGVITSRPVRASAKRVTAGDEANPIIDKLIIEHITAEGKASESGTGRAVSGEIKGHGKVGRPRVMKRVLALVEEGKIIQFEDEAGVRYKMPGSDGLKIKVDDKKATPAKAKATKTPKKTTVAKKDVVSEAPKKRGRPRKEETLETVETPAAKKAAVETPVVEVKVQSKAKSKAKAKVQVEMKDVDSSEAMTAIRSMLEQNKHVSSDALINSFKEIFAHIEAQDVELAKWRLIGANMVSQIGKI